MSQSEHIQLIHAVLDNEASPQEKQDLERLMASDSGVRQQFESMQHLFTVIGQVPEATPPTGLIDLTMAKIPLRQARPGRWRQPFWRSRVLVTESVEARSPSPGITARVHRASGPIQHIKGFTMSDQKSSFFKSTKGKFAIGTGVAAALVVTVSSFVDFPIGGTDTAGTIAPAQRYRAAQNTAQDINVSSPSAQQVQSTTAGIGDTSGAAGRAAGSASGAASAAVESSAGDAAGRAAGNASGAAKAAMDSAAGDAAGRASGSAKAAMDSAAGDAAGRASGKAAGAASGSAKAAVESSSGDAAGRASGSAAGAASGKASGAASGKAAGAASGSAKAAMDSAAGDAAGRASGAASGTASGKASGAASGAASGKAAGAASGSAKAAVESSAGDAAGRAAGKASGSSQ